MKEFKATTTKNVKVVLDDREYIVRLPKVEDQIKLNDMVKGLDETSSEQTGALISWLETLGLPKDVTLSMYQVDLTSFINDFLLDSKKK